MSGVIISAEASDLQDIIKVQLTGGDSTALPSALEEAPKPELKRQQPDEEPRQQAESSTAKRLKTVPRKESKQAEAKVESLKSHVNVAYQFEISTAK